MNKLVSTIMPVFNTSQYLDVSIPSILNQTYSNLELILINDGSTDSSLDIMLHYAKSDSRVVLLSRSTNNFIPAINDGIKIARGEYIARMDSDDISHPNRFALQVDYLNRHRDIYLLGTNYSILFEPDISEKTKKKYEGSWKRGQLPIDSEDVFFSINEGQKFMQPSTMMRRELFDMVGFYQEYLIEDIEFYFRVAKKGLGIAKLEETLFTYRAREGSRSTDAFRKVQTNQIIRMKLQFLLTENPNLNQIQHYSIWGADISGAEAYQILREALPAARCVAFIDPYKIGEKKEAVEVLAPEALHTLKVDYIFICTQSGAHSARAYLKSLGKQEQEDYFKIS